MVKNSVMEMDVSKQAQMFIHINGATQLAEDFVNKKERDLDDVFSELMVHSATIFLNENIKQTIDLLLKIFSELYDCVAVLNKSSVDLQMAYFDSGDGKPHFNEYCINILRKQRTHWENLKVLLDRYVDSVDVLLAHFSDTPVLDDYIASKAFTAEVKVTAGVTQVALIVLDQVISFAEKGKK